MSLYLYLVMAKNYFKSYVWLLDTIQSRGPLTLNQIKELWSRSSINEDKKNWLHAPSQITSQPLPISSALTSSVTVEITLTGSTTMENLVGAACETG